MVCRWQIATANMKKSAEAIVPQEIMGRAERIKFVNRNVCSVNEV